MVRLAANLSMLFTELPFLERFEASRREGFDAVEFAYPNDTALDKILKALQGSRQQQVLGTLPAPAGDKGVAALVGAEDEFRRRFQLGIEAATAAACPLVHITTGVVPEADRAAASEVFERNLQWALRIAEQCGLRLAIEAVNPVDLPGYFIRSLDDARAWISRIASPNFGLLVDLYHARMEGRRIADVLGLIPAEAFHVQIAGAPGRAEPDKGDVDFGLAFDTLDSAGWSGWIGCEYRPATTTLEGLPWVDRLVPGFRRRTRHEVR